MNAGFTIILTLCLIGQLDVSKCMKVKIGNCILVLGEDNECPDPDYIRIYLFTRKNKSKGQYISITKSSDNMTSSSFNRKHPNKVIIHGFNSDMFLDALIVLKNEYLAQKEYNIWMVNYPRLAQHTICYPFAVHNIHHVGACMAQLVTALRRHASTDIHVVGFSMGAHVANYMANKLYKYKIPRITGLDPAGPLFEGRSRRHRLDPSDARFVDVVHTNGLVQGNIQRCGHIDFYMNGGVNQPGCLQKEESFSCDHRRAVEYFVESVRTEVGFLGWPCKGYPQYLRGECPPSLPLEPMGEHCSSRRSGYYLVYTASEKPYALGNWTKDEYRKRAPDLKIVKNKAR